MTCVLLSSRPVAPKRSNSRDRRRGRLWSRSQPSRRCKLEGPPSPNDRSRRLPHSRVLKVGWAPALDVARHGQPDLPLMHGNGYTMEFDLDEVHAAAGLFGLAAGYFGDRRLAEDLAQGGDALGPDAAGLVGLVADFAVERLDDVEDGDLLRGAGQGVAAAHPAVAGQQAVAAQGREELLEELLRDIAALGELLDRHRPLSRACQLRHCDDGIPGL